MKFLMIANSFGVNLQTYARDIAKANDCDLDIYVLYIGGCSLDTHLRNIEADAKSYELFNNGVSTGKMISIKDALLMDKWDVISLQQASHMSGQIDSYYPYFEKVYNFVKENAPNSEIVFHQTWAYSSINSYKYETVPCFCQSFTFKNAKQMKKGIDYCYKKVCFEYGIKKIIRSGDVCQLAMKKIGDVYDLQGFHMNGLGCYLIGCNLIVTLFKIKLTNVFVPENLGKKTCENAVKFINTYFSK